MSDVVIGIDIGGTNTAIGIVDRAGHCHSSGLVRTSDFSAARPFAEAVRDQIQVMLNAGDTSWQLRGIGIGAPNGNYYHGTLEYAPNLKWPGIIPLAGWFREFFNMPAALTNDANAAAIGEMLFGAAKDFSDFIVITLGTGVGSGIVVHGDLVYGHDGFAGEIGHTIYDPEGRECGCGRRGCLETYASAGGIKRTVFELLSESRAESELRFVSFHDLSAEHISQAALNGDPIALQAFDITGKILGIKLADAVAHTSPQAIILFGGLAKAGKLIFEPTAKYMNHYMLNLFKGKVKLLPSSLDHENVAILGAAALIWKELEK